MVGGPACDHQLVSDPPLVMYISLAHTKSIIWPRLTVVGFYLLLSVLFCLKHTIFVIPNYHHC